MADTVMFGSDLVGLLVLILVVLLIVYLIRRL